MIPHWFDGSPSWSDAGIGCHPFAIYLILALGQAAAYDRPLVQRDRMFFPDEIPTTFRVCPEFAAR